MNKYAAAGRKKYLYGPVPSRRLGRSLGVDIVPQKICTLDCVYCQLGKSSQKTIERRNYVSADAILAELKQALSEGLEVDYITIAGSGEPTLNSELGALIDGIRKITAVKVAVLTNGTLLTEPAVRVECAKADVVLPSLDASDEKTFQRINRPHEGISFEKFVEGLIKFRSDFAGQIWLEVFMVEGINTDKRQIENLKGLIERIRPDKVQLNTAVRPTFEPGIKPLPEAKLMQIASELGPKAEVVADYEYLHTSRRLEIDTQTVLEMLKRRPCSLEDICSGLGLKAEEAQSHLNYLMQTGLIESEKRGNVTFFKAQ